MREVSELLGVPEDFSKPNGSVNERQLKLDASELQEMGDLAAAALESITQLQAKSNQFEAEIGQLSSAMAVLKSQSALLHHKLRTRAAALAELDPLLKKYVPSSHDVDLIFEGEIGPAWYEALDRIRAPLHAENSKLAESAQRLRRVLLSRAIERAKQLFLAKLRALRRPGTDAQLVQRDLLAAKPALQLLTTQTPRLAHALAQAYQNTMRWYYTMLFGKYGRWLGRQPLMVADQPKLLGQAVSRTSFFSAMGAAASAHSVDAFSVGARPTILDASSALPLPMATPVSPAMPYYPLEAMVNCLLTALADSVEIEAQMSEVVRQPLTEKFSNVLEFYSIQIQTWISQCAYDLFGLMLVIRLCEESPLHNYVPEFTNSIITQCWPHIQSVCDEQARSIETAALKASNPSKGPHILTQLVSSYFSGVLQVCTVEMEPRLKKSLTEIIEAYELFITKLAHGNEDVMHTNYFVMAALLSDIPGHLAQETAKHFQLLVDAYAR